MLKSMLDEPDAVAEDDFFEGCPPKRVIVAPNPSISEPTCQRLRTLVTVGDARTTYERLQILLAMP